MTADQTNGEGVSRDVDGSYLNGDGNGGGDGGDGGDLLAVDRL